MDSVLYGLLAARARCKCECGCGVSVPPGEVDHWFGRARADEVEATCWILSPRCHYMKTQNSPDASHWLRRFIEHCAKWGYLESKQRAEARLFFVDTRRSLGARHVP